MVMECQSYAVNFILLVIGGCTLHAFKLGVCIS